MGKGRLIIMIRDKRCEGRGREHLDACANTCSKKYFTILCVTMKEKAARRLIIMNRDKRCEGRGESWRHVPTRVLRST